MTRDAFLRRLALSDVADVLDAFSSSPDMDRQGDVHSLADAERYVARLLAEDSNALPWAIELDGRAVGLVCINVDRANRVGWFWYWLHADARGHGLMRRAAATVANWALATGELERLELGHRANNPASGAVALAAGFIHEGTERAKFLVDGERIDVLTYGRLANDPRPGVAELEFR